MARKNAEAEDLNLVPIMNLVTILIPFLLMAAQFVSSAVIDVSMPALDKSTRPTPPSDELQLTVAITDQGYTVAGAGGVLPAIPRGPDGAWDTDGLAAVLSDIKDAHPVSSAVILAPEPAVPYEVLVSTMDATRGTEARPLFPEVLVAGGTAN